MHPEKTNSSAKAIGWSVSAAAVIALLPLAATDSPHIKDRLAQVRAVVAQTEVAGRPGFANMSAIVDSGFANAPQPDAGFANSP
jgi:hypothetical protein